MNRERIDRAVAFAMSSVCLDLECIWIEDLYTSAFGEEKTSHVTWSHLKPRFTRFDTKQKVVHRVIQAFYEERRNLNVILENKQRKLCEVFDGCVFIKRNKEEVITYLRKLIFRLCLDVLQEAEKQDFHWLFEIMDSNDLEHKTFIEETDKYIINLLVNRKECAKKHKRR